MKAKERSLKNRILKQYREALEKEYQLTPILCGPIGIEAADVARRVEELIEVEPDSVFAPRKWIEVEDDIEKL